MLPSIEEIKKVIVVPGNILIAELHDFKPLPGLLGPLQYSGGFSVVFTFSNGQVKKALRIWYKEIPQIHKRTVAVADYLSFMKDVPYFVNYKFIPQCIRSGSGLLDAVLMDWVEGETLKDYINRIITSPSLSASEKQETLKGLCIAFYEMFQVLHRYHISHGDLQHGNIIVQGSNMIRLLDYDSFFIPKMGSRMPQVTTGLSGYQHPARAKTRFSSEKDDYFSELVIITALLALAEDLSVWEDYSANDNEYSLLFTSRDYSDFPKSGIYKRLLHCSDSVRGLLSEIDRSLGVDSIDCLDPVEEVMSRCHTQISYTKKDVYCTRCGTKYNRVYYYYCVICGNKRY